MILKMSLLLLACNTDAQKTTPPKNTINDTTQIKEEMVIESTELRVFEMLDGSTIVGLLMGTDGEGFRVRSQSLGVIRIPMKELSKMNPQTEQNFEPRNQTKTTTLSNYSATQNTNSLPNSIVSTQFPSQEMPTPNRLHPKLIKTIQDNMMEDPKIMEILYTLQNDAQIMKALQDPEVLNLIKSGDVKAINEHPTFKLLESNQHIQNILEQMR